MTVTFQYIVTLILRIWTHSQFKLYKALIMFENLLWWFNICLPRSGEPVARQKSCTCMNILVSYLNTNSTDTLTISKPPPPHNKKIYIRWRELHLKTIKINIFLTYQLHLLDRNRPKSSEQVLRKSVRLRVIGDGWRRNLDSRQSRRWFVWYHPGKMERGKNRWGVLL